MFEMSMVAAELQSELGRLRADGPERGLSELVAMVGACQSVINQATALQSLAMAHVAANEDVAGEDGMVVEQHRGLGHQRLDAPALVSDQLGVSDAVASSRLGAAVELVTRVPKVFQAMADGRLDGYRARVVSEELREAPVEVCAQVVDRIAEALGTEPSAMLRRRVRSALGAVDGDLVRAKAARARSERSLCRWPGDEPGVDTWMGSFPVEQSRSGWAVVDGLARQYVRAGAATNLGQARADALMDLIHARATGTFVVQLASPADQPGAIPAGMASCTISAGQHDVIPSDRHNCITQPDAKPISAVTGTASVAASLGEDVVAEVGEDVVEDDELVTVAGLGMPGTTQVRRAWVEALTNTDSSTDTARPGRVVARREVVACDSDTGALLMVETDSDHIGRPTHDKDPRDRRRQVPSTESQAYRPPQALIDLVKARDGRCRFPGCTVNARFCDVDRVQPWPAGPTHQGNLMCLCRRHHRIKQTIRWRVRIDPDATVTWTDPTGTCRTTLPIDFLQLDASMPSDRAQVRDHPMPDRQPPETSRTWVVASTDTPEALWSAWEEELVHELTRCERATRSGRQRRRHLSEEGHGARPLRPLDPAFGLDPYVLDAAFVASCPRPNRPGAADDEPPF